MLPRTRHHRLNHLNTTEVVNLRTDGTSLEDILLREPRPVECILARLQLERPELGWWRATCIDRMDITQPREDSVVDWLIRLQEHTRRILVIRLKDSRVRLCNIPVVDSLLKDTNRSPVEGMYSSNRVRDSRTSHHTLPEVTMTRVNKDTIRDIRDRRPCTITSSLQVVVAELERSLEQVQPDWPQESVVLPCTMR